MRACELAYSAAPSRAEPSPAQHSTTQPSPAQHGSTAQHSTAWCRIGRKDRFEILHRYLLRNLRVNGGVLDKVQFVVFAAMHEDLVFLHQAPRKGQKGPRDRALREVLASVGPRACDLWSTGRPAARPSCAFGARTPPHPQVVDEQAPHYEIPSVTGRPRSVSLMRCAFPREVLERCPVSLFGRRAFEGESKHARRPAPREDLLRLRRPRHDLHQDRRRHGSRGRDETGTWRTDSKD